jgi:hypothetical protein
MCAAPKNGLHLLNAAARRLRRKSSHQLKGHYEGEGPQHHQDEPAGKRGGLQEVAQDMPALVRPVEKGVEAGSDQACETADQRRGQVNR